MAGWFLAVEQRSRWIVGAMNLGMAVVARAAEALNHRRTLDVTAVAERVAFGAQPRARDF
jgi:hypothetical protein